MAAKRKHRSTNEYLKYLKGELSPEERYSFERDLEADPFEMEAMEGMEQIAPDALVDDLLSLHANLRSRLRRRKRRTWYYAAATVASLLIVGTVFLNIYEINPKTASESIPADETFLYEDAGTQQDEKSKAIDLEEAAPEGEVREAEVREREVRERETPAVHEELKDIEIEDADVVEFVEAAAEVSEDAAMAVEADAVEADAVEADAVAETPAQAPVRDEVIMVEAQPKRSQKKGRAKEVEAPVSYDAEFADDLEFAANRIGGIVLSSEDMKPLPGASIALKGVDSGLVADMDGRFSLVAGQEEATTIIASYVGMETNEYELAAGTENQILMKPDQMALSEVVVIGYDADKSRYASGAVQTVNFKQEEFTYSGAEPEGGLDAYKMYIEEQIRFPAGDSLSKKEVVVLKFIVGRDGSISGIQTLRSPGEGFTEEAIRLLQEGPAWDPARNESGVTDDVVRMRIVFKR